MAKSTKNTEIVVIQKKGTNSALLDSDELPLLRKHEVLQTIHTMQLAGKTKTDICEYLLSEGINDLDYHKKLIDQSNKHFEENIIEGDFITDVISLHVLKYEEIYEAFTKLKYLDGRRKALYAKEKLLGLRREDNVLEINQQNNIVIDDSSSQYNTDKLSPEEKARLEFLMSKVQEEKND